MKTAAIIAEYNPFHNGHQYHIQKTKEITGADFVIGLMSGDFVQRGAPAVIDKYERALAALEGGCDLILELPVIYSSSSAEFFASGAIALLDGLGVCDYLSFGSEMGSLKELSFLSNILLEEPEEYQRLLRLHLKAGNSFPKAREAALTSYCQSLKNCQFSNEFINNLKAPNNILALEYLKALKKQDSHINPVTLPRKNTSYHDKKLYEDISSATAIRHSLINHQEPSQLQGTVPNSTLRSLVKASHSGSYLDTEDFTPYLHSALLLETRPETIWDMGTELANRLRKLSWATLTFLELTELLKNRQITAVRIQRSLLHLILGLRTEDFYLQYNRRPAPYAKILGFRKESTLLLKTIKEKSQIPLITKPASTRKLIDPADLWAFEMDLRAGLLYQSMMFQKSGLRLPNAMERSPIIYETGL